MNNQILNIVLDYVKNKNNNSAIMINGDWGSGKTYFVKNLLCIKIENALYIPLYGITNIEEINEKICYEILKVKNPLKRRKNKSNNSRFYKIRKKIVDAIIKVWNSKILTKIRNPIYFIVKLFKRVFYSILTNSLKPTLGIDLKLVKKKDFIGIINQTTMLNNYVLIFDDLERCNLDINIVMGFINNLVEHKNVKTIIVANEQEITNIESNNEELRTISVLNDKVKFPKLNRRGKTSIFLDDDEETGAEKIDKEEIESRKSYLYSNNEKYKKIKEKLISNTIEYVPDFDNVINSYRKNYQLEVNNIIDNQLIKKIMDNCECKNLRTLKVALDYFEQIYIKSSKYILKKYKKNSGELYRKILINTLYVTIAQKKDIYIPKILNDSLYANTSIEKEFLISKNNFDAFSFVNNYISSLYFDEDLMKKCLEYYYALNLNSYPLDNSLHTLEYYWESEDDELKNALQNIKDNISNYDYRLYPTIIIKFACLLAIDFESNLINEIIEQMKDCIQGKEIDYIDFHSMVETPEIRKIYDEKVAEFESIIKNNSDYIYKSKLEMIIDSDDWGIELFNYVRECSSNSMFINEKGFLAKFDINKLIDVIKKSDNKNIYGFRSAIRLVYRYANIWEYYKADANNIRTLIDGLNKINNESDKLKHMAITYLIDDLTEKLNIIEQN